MTPFHQDEAVKVRALRTVQGDGVPLYALFMLGKDLLRLADITRIRRDVGGELQGFQRDAIRSHVKNIVDFLNRGAVIFPNAIILAMSPEVKFERSRGSKPQDVPDLVESGRIVLPLRREGMRAAWIVDGQQRALALARSKNQDILVPVVGFVSPDIEVHREQFILVNKAKPLPTRLINELLPETGGHIPADLSIKQVPSLLCDWLNRREDSPFQGIIRRPSDPSGTRAVVTDTAVISMVSGSMGQLTGVLSPLKHAAGGQPDVEEMYRILRIFWTAVRNVFRDAWGKPPTESRLMHGAGIQAMGPLMDRIMGRAVPTTDPAVAAGAALERIAPGCHWTDGEWARVQNTKKHVRDLAEYLVHLDYESSRR